MKSCLSEMEMTLKQLHPEDVEIPQYVNSSPFDKICIDSTVFCLRLMSAKIIVVSAYWWFSHDVTVVMFVSHNNESEGHVGAVN